MTTERFRLIGNRIYDIQKAIQIADNRSEVDVLAWSGNNRTASANLDFRRAMESDSSQPIVIAHGKVIDGSDRLYKALKTGIRKMPAFILSDEQAFSIMAIKTAVKRVHPDVAKEIRQKHKAKEDLSHPFYALEKRKPGDKDRTCRECNQTIQGDALYFDRATGDEPWLRDKGYLCLEHDGSMDIEKWIRCPRRECAQSVPESDWSAHWRDHSVAASVHRYHLGKVAHCGQCEDDRELEEPKKRTVNTDGTVVDEELTKQGRSEHDARLRLAGDVIGPEVFERKLRERPPSPEETKEILEGTPSRRNHPSMYERYVDDPDQDPDPAAPRYYIDTQTGERIMWHPGLKDLDDDDKPRRPWRRGAISPQDMNIGLPNPQFPEWQPRVDRTKRTLTDPTMNSAVQREVDELGRGFATFTGQPRPSDPTILRVRAAKRRRHHHTVTDRTGTQFRSVPCGEHLLPGVRLASSNRRDKEQMQSLIDEWHDNTTVEHELPEGFHIRRLNTIGDHIVEGTMLKHCLNEGTRAMMGETVPHPLTGEATILPGTPVIPRDPDMRWSNYELPRLFREQGKPFFSEEEQNIGGQTIPAWRYQGPLFSLRSKDNLPKATFFHPINHDTGEMNKLVAHDIYGVNNKELHSKYRYRVYQYMLDNLNDDTTGADSVTLRWGKTYEGEEGPNTPEELITSTETLSRSELEAKVQEMDRQYVRNETEKTQMTNRRVAHSYGKHGHTYIDDFGNAKTVLCSFGRNIAQKRAHRGEFINWRTANTTVKESQVRDELLSLYGDSTTPRHTFGDGFSIRRLNSLGDYLFEGNMNRNCLRQYAQHAIDNNRVPNENDYPFEISHFPYIMGESETDNPLDMVVQDRPWRYTGPFYSLRDDNGVSKATFFHPIDHRTGEPNFSIIHDIFGINNAELNNRYKSHIYRYMLNNLDMSGDTTATIRWGLTNPGANIMTPEDELTNTEILTTDGLRQRINELGRKYRSRKPTERIARSTGWRSVTSDKNDCTCWEGYERVPGTEPCAPGSCRKKKRKKSGLI